MVEEIAEGSWILLYIDRKRRKILRVSNKAKYSSDKGTIDLGGLMGSTYGVRVTTSIGAMAYIYKPTTCDLVYSVFSRPSQVIYPKDAGYAILMLDISPGKKILEIGVGSGVMTALIANLVRPEGRVYAYEIREDMARIALENLRRIGMDRYVELKIRDATQGVDEKDLDAAFIDIGDPWRVVDVVYNALKPGSPAAFFTPTFNQLLKLHATLMEHKGWGYIECVEILERPIELKENAVRPSTRMIAHTGFIVTAKKHLKDSSDKSIGG
ncbi:MAG: tRNA (adenine-N1)-methyltransferase [Sulfolobales archaeon]